MNKIIFIISMLATNFAFAQWTVYDPINHIQNTSSALAAIKNEINSASALIQQIKGTIALAKSLESAGNLSALAGVQEELKLYNQLKNNDIQISSTLDQQIKLSSDLLAQHGASNTNWANFINQKSTSQSTQSKAMLEQANFINSSLASTAQRRQDVVNQLQNSTGQTSAIQAVGAAIDILIGQNQQIIAALANKTKAESAAIQINSNSNLNSIQINNDYQKKLLDAANKY